MKKLLCFSIFLLALLIHTSPLFAASSQNSCRTWIASLSHSLGSTPNQTMQGIQKVAEQAMRNAGKKILKLRLEKDFQIEQKKNFSDLKTKGDCTSQDIILNKLSQSKFTQNANFVAEEKCSKTESLLEKKKSEENATWVLDPIDGTTNYAHGMPHFGISLALVVDRQPCFGAVYGPVYDEFFFAWDNRGAFLKRDAKMHPEKIQVSLADDLKSSLWITGTEGGPKPAAIDKNKKTFEMALELLPKTHDLRRTGSAALDLASVASGRAEAFFELSEGLNWWDIAAGILLVKEAGGKVSVKEPETIDEDLGPLERPIVYVLATNKQPEIHKSILSILEQKSSENEHKATEAQKNDK